MMKKSTILNSFIFGFVLIASVFTLLPQQVKAGWTEQTSSDSHYWCSITSSSDGTKLAAVDCNQSGGGYIYASTDSGNTWVQKTSGTKRYWQSITSDSTGQYLAAVATNNDYIYTSIDYGTTWTPRDSQRSWIAITSDSTGQYLAAVVSSGYIYTSINYGTTWIQKTNDTARAWTSIVSDFTGQNLAAVNNNPCGGCLGLPGIHNSIDYGENWILKNDINLGWVDIASSFDGTKLAAVVSNGYIYTSIDSGNTWLQKTTDQTRNWKSITSSFDGTKLAAVVSNGYIYTSIDSGNTWIEQTSAGSHNYYSITSSSDGTKLVAGVYSGYIYTYAPDDLTPDSFTLTDQTGVSLSTPTESNTITVAGINASTSISISSCTSVLCEYKINSGSYTSTAGNVVNGDTVTVRQTSSATEMTMTNLVLDIGGVTDTFSVTTKDTTIPTITITGESNINIYKGSTYTDQGATANDNIDGDITSNIITVNPVDTDSIGTYTIAYNVDDNAGNHAVEVTRTVNVNKRPSSGGSYVSPRINPPTTPVIPPTPTSCSQGQLFNTTNGQPCTSYTQTPTNPTIPTYTEIEQTLYDTARTLRITMQGEDVRQLQIYLNTHNYPVGIQGVGSPNNETTYFGERTKQAVIKFQIANNLKPDGVVGPLTREKMK